MLGRDFNSRGMETCRGSIPPPRRAMLMLSSNWNQGLLAEMRLAEKSRLNSARGRPTQPAEKRLLAEKRRLKKRRLQPPPRRGMLMLTSNWIEGRLAETRQTEMRQAVRLISASGYLFSQPLAEMSQLG